MFWLKIGGFFIPLLSYLALVYGSVLSIGLEVKIIIATIGFLLGGLTSSALHELGRWFENISTAYGSAMFAAPMEMRRAKLYGKQGLLLGRHKGRLVRFAQPGHLCTLSPTRGGKTSTAVIPCLLDYTQGSICVVDIKGEAYDVTARFRRTIGSVFRFAPYETNSHCFNPFDFIRSDSEADAWEDSAKLADALVIPSGESKAVFFENEAKSLLTGLILYVATEAPREHRNLSQVRRLITLSADALKEQMKIMQQARHPLVRRMADSFSAKEPKLQSNIMATSQSYTLFLDSQRVATITSRSDFSLSWLKESIMTLYIVVPPERLNLMRPLVRLMLSMAVDTMTRPIVDRPQDPFWQRLQQDRDWHVLQVRETWSETLRRWWKGNDKQGETVFLVDEFPSLGYMRPLAPDGIAYLAGYGAKLWFFSQSIGQIKSVYGEQITQAIMANCNIQCFSNTDNETLETISRMLGNETVRVHHKSRTRHSWVLPDYDNFNVGAGETGRALLTPDEIRCLGDDRQLLFIKGLRPIMARKVPYYKEARWRGLWDKWRGGRNNG